MDEISNQFATLDLPPRPSKTRTYRAKESYRQTEKECRILQNRVAILREKQAKMAQENVKFSDKTKEVERIKKENQEIALLKDRDNRAELEFVQLQRQRNRQRHAKNLQDIRDLKTAIQLVKISEAREIKNLSLQHSQRLSSIRQSEHMANKSRVQSIEQDKTAAKANIKSMRKAKLMQVQDKKADYISNYASMQAQQKHEIMLLQQQEKKILQKMKYSQRKNMGLRNQYIEALTASRKDVYEKYSRSNSRQLDNSPSIQLTKPSYNSDERSRPQRYRAPIVQVNGQKFKAALSMIRNSKTQTKRGSPVTTERDSQILQ